MKLIRALWGNREDIREEVPTTPDDSVVYVWGKDNLNYLKSLGYETRFVEDTIESDYMFKLIALDLAFKEFYYCMFLDWDGTIEYQAWPDAPKYRTLPLSKLIDNPEKYLADKTYARVTLDVGITYEEANFIKETFAKQYDLREISLIPSKKEEHTNDWQQGVDIEVENVDTIVLSQLDSVQSDTIKKQMLIDIYTGLTS